MSTNDVEKKPVSLSDSETDGSNDDMEEHTERVCHYCGDKPCFWETFKDKILHKIRKHKKKTPLS